MSDRPTPEEAARALRDVERRKDQTVNSVGVALWVRIVFGIAIFVALAAPDSFGSQVTTWSAWPLTLIAVAYVIMLNSRRGSAVLGQPARLRGEEISPRFAATRRVVLMVVLAVGIVVAFIPHGRLDVPYLRTVIGAVAGLALVVFGDRYQKAMNSFARRDRAARTPDGEGAGGTR
ncbi:MAG TPA: hypothetical protein VGL93_23670 [Streptosporangiaceae bacterium]